MCSRGEAFSGRGLPEAGGPGIGEGAEDDLPKVRGSDGPGKSHEGLAHAAGGLVGGRHEIGQVVVIPVHAGRALDLQLGLSHVLGHLGVEEDHGALRELFGEAFRVGPDFPVDAPGLVGEDQGQVLGAGSGLGRAAAFDQNGNDYVRVFDEIGYKYGFFNFHPGNTP